MLRAHAFAIGGAAAVLTFVAPLTRSSKPRPDVPLDLAKIYWEYNSTDADLGIQVSLDGEEWQRLQIHDPNGKSIFEVRGRGSLGQIGLSELFFEGSEPSLSDVPLEEMLGRFPEGVYEFEGRTVDGEEIGGQAFFSHVMPAGPAVTTTVGSSDLVRISWTAVTSTPPGFPSGPIEIAAYQVLVDETFQMNVPASTLSVTLPPEFVASLASGAHTVEVLAIDRNHNQTITEASFVK